MTYTISYADVRTICVAIEGELDAVTVSDLRVAVERILSGEKRDVCVDLSRLRMIDSSGVGAIVSFYKRLRALGRRVTIEGARDQPLAIFRLLRLDRVLLAPELVPVGESTVSVSYPTPDSAPYLRTLPDAGEALKHAKERGRGATLLVGAGCSASAGIKVASEVVDVIALKFPRAYRRQPEKTYRALMAELTVGERHDLIASLTEGATPNLAHRAIARLIRDRYVRRVLTTNFDDLLPRACAEIGVPYFAHDLATSEQYDPSLVREQAIFYVHGRDGGFLQHHFGPAMHRHDMRLGPLIADAVVGRPLLVVGYSGLSDPLFDTLAAVPRFTYGLYWATFQRQFPDSHVTKELLRPDRHAYFIPASDADELFTDLCAFLNVPLLPVQRDDGEANATSSAGRQSTPETGHTGEGQSGSPRASTETVNCGNCGARLVPGFPFCGKCGELSQQRRSR